jgi:hypothetical protein
MEPWLFGDEYTDISQPKTCSPADESVRVSYREELLFNVFNVQWWGNLPAPGP